MSASLAAQKAIRARLVATTAVTALVPATNIIDRNARPNPDPSIVIGEDQELDDDRIARDVVRIYSTVHVWKRENSLVGVKAIAGAIRNAIAAAPMPVTDGWHFADCHVSTTRFLRDPDGETAHGVVTIESLMREVSP
jgi:hypothetical protein